MNAHPMTALRAARRRFAGRRPWLTDLALGGGLTAVDVATLLARHPAPGPAGVPLWALQTLPLFWRRRFPRTVLAAMTAAFIAFEVLAPVQGKTPGPFLLVFGVYALARCTPLRVSLPGTVLSLAAAVATDLLTGQAGPPKLGSLEPITATTFAAFYAVAWLLGYGRRRISIQAGRLRDLNARLHDVNCRLQDANERLRAEQEANARQAVAAERTRIARDLHDVVAHHVSAIAVQARSTEEIIEDVLRDDPRGALRDDLRGVARIAETADTALVEMRRILGLLTARDEEADLAPEPSLRHLDRLLTAVGSAGCAVTATLDEDALGDVPPALQVSAYRIVQEALTNVLKHAGPAAVSLTVRHDGAALAVEVENGPPVAGHRPVPGSGRGLIGIRERVAAFGGTVRNGPRPHGGWRLHATLPVPLPAGPAPSQPLPPTPEVPSSPEVPS
ncbi:sensor histidine kinase [Streptomyces sp. GS7]|nr:sensor histidine kinase [Streptomyces sp. GS7]